MKCFKISIIFILLQLNLYCDKKVFIQPAEIMKEVKAPEGHTGVFTAYYSNGQKKSECIYINGVKEGVEIKYFWRTGRIMSTYTYVGGILNGVFSKYADDKKSTCFARGYYLNGEPYQGTFDYNNFTGEFCKDTFHFGQIDLSIISIVLENKVEVGRYSMNAKRPEEFGEVGSLVEKLNLFKSKN